MKRNSLLKLTIVLGLSVLLILGLNSFVLAVDDDVPWSNAIVEPTTTTPTPSPTTDIITTPSPTSTVPTITPTEIDNTTNDISENTTNNTANESIPYTGIEDINTVFALAVLIVLAVAVYSLKKVNDYNNL